MRATEHNVRSHAHTRAYARAVSNLVGFGEVSAEEVDRSDAPPAPVARVVPRPKVTTIAADNPPAGYHQWLLTLTAVAGRGTAPLRLAWNDSPLAFKRLLTRTNLAGWKELKTRAERACR